MVDPARTGIIRGKEIQADLARSEMIEALRTGNVYEVLKKAPILGITHRDIEEYMGNQWKAFQSLVQDYKIYEPEASVPEVSLTDFRMHDENATMRPGEGVEFMKGMMTSFRRTASKAEGDVPPPEEGQDLAGLTGNTLDEWDSFMNDVWGGIIDQQFVAEYNKKMAEVQKGVREIIALAKSGRADVETVLLALVKVNQTKNGCLMTWMGKKAFMTNEKMNRIAEDLKLSGNDPAMIMDVQAKTRDGSFQLNLLVADMQKVVQDSASVLEQVKGFIDELNRTRREIITKLTTH